MRKLPRGLPGMVEVPALKELNDIRELTRKSYPNNSGYDLSVYDEPEFTRIANGITNDKFTPEQLHDAYSQLHLISELGSSANPMMRLIPSASTQGRNVGKYDYEIIPSEQELVDRDNFRSREASAIAMLEDAELRSVQENGTYLAETTNALQDFITSSSIGRLGNSGFRKKKPQGEELLASATQNLNDMSGGNDRLSGDYIRNQPVEFGHYVPANKGGADDRSNGRMQAMAANRAMGDRLGVPGAMSALSGDYARLAQNRDKYKLKDYNVDTSSVLEDRYAGDIFL
mgnify:CR=1 FL=1